ncbi:unnamed protein product, partial [Medioppia subpectinata]
MVKSEALLVSKQLAKNMNCSEEEEDNWLECLRGFEAQELMDGYDTRRQLSALSDTEFLPMNAQNMFENKLFNKDLDIMAGVMRNEGSIQSQSLVKPNLTEKDFNEFVTIIDAFYHNFDEKLVTDFYLKSIDKNSSDALKWAEYDMFGDLMTTCPTYRFAKAYGQLGGAGGVYFYEQTYQRKSFLDEKVYGVTHFADIDFVFGSPLLAPTVTDRPIDTQFSLQDHNINEYTLSNSTGGLEVKIIDYGATITHVFVTDKSGQKRDVVLGWDDLEGYLGNRGRNPFFGAAIGRCGNRISNGKFKLNGQSYTLALNNGPNALHGGLKGYDKHRWTLIGKTNDSISLELVSPDGDEGYPGELRVELTYTVTEANELTLDYTARLAAAEHSVDTIVNLTNHSYFNLSGCSGDGPELDVLNHTVRMSVHNYLDINDAFQPTGKILSTKSDTPAMDFATGDDQEWHTIGERIGQVLPNGYDHCYVIDTDAKKYNISGNESVNEAVVEVRSPLTGISLTFSTTEPGFQFYTGNNVTEAQRTKTTQAVPAIELRKNSGFCLE